MTILLNNKNGMSPIIATIILIVIIISAATIVYIWAHTETQRGLQREEMLRERQMDKKAEVLVLTHVEYTSTEITLIIQNTGTSDTELGYFLVTYSVSGEEYIPNTNFISVQRNGVAIPSPYSNPIPLDMGDVLEITVAYIGEDANGNWVLDNGEDNGDGVLDTIVSVEFGTVLGNKYVYTRPNAVIKIETSYEDENNTYYVFDGSLSSDVEGSIVNWEWMFNYDPLNLFTPDTTGEKVLYGFNTPGTYTILLKVTDDTGMASYTTIEITISYMEVVL